MSWRDKYKFRKTLDGNYVLIDGIYHPTYAKVTDPGKQHGLRWYYYYKVNDKFIRLYNNKHWKWISKNQYMDLFPELFI